MAQASSDLLWEIVRPNSAFLVKRRTAGGLQFSRDPLNVTGLYTPTASGFTSDKAVGVVQTADGKVQLLTKSSKNANKPAKAVSVTTFKSKASGRRVAHAVAKATHGYRDDLTKFAVVKASAFTRTEKPKKSYPSKKR